MEDLSKEIKSNEQTTREPTGAAVMELVWCYLHIYFSRGGFGRLLEILSPGLIFEGPLASFKSADDYITALEEDPPKGFSFEVLHTFKQGNSVTIVYNLFRPQATVLCSQYFEVENKRISRIHLIFNPLDLSPSS